MGEIQLICEDPAMQMSLLADLYGSDLHVTGNFRHVAFQREGRERYVRNYSPFRGMYITVFDILPDKTLCLEYPTASVPNFEFLYVSTGQVWVRDHKAGTQLALGRRQNGIFDFDSSAHRSLIFPGNIPTRLLHIRTDAHLQPGNLLAEDMLRFMAILKRGQSLPHLDHIDNRLAGEIEKLENLQPVNEAEFAEFRGRVHIVLAQHLQQLYDPNMAEDHPVLSTSEIAKIREAARYIEAHLSEPLRVEGISKACKWNEKHMQAGFRRFFSKSVSAYVRDRKLEAAQKMLRDTNLTVSEVVYSIGMTSRSHFSKIFYEKFGVLPKDYRST